MVRLKRASKVRLSSTDVNRVISVFKDELVSILLDTDLEKLHSSEPQRDAVVIPLESQGWKIEVKISKTHASVVRQVLKGELLTVRPEDKYGNYMKLLQKHTDFVFNKETEEEEERGLVDLDAKKASAVLTYSLVPFVLRGFSLYVMKRP